VVSGRAITATIRDGTHADIDAIAALHSTSWQDSYRGQIPDAFLDGPVIADRHALWTDRLGEPAEGTVLLIGEVAGRLSGFVYLAPARDPGWYLLDNLHVDAEQRGSGLGTLLMQTAARRLTRLGCQQVVLYVMASNSAACRFYERLGAAHAGVASHSIAGLGEFDMVSLRWERFGDLAFGAGG